MYLADISWCSWLAVILGERHEVVGRSLERLASPECLTDEPLHTAGALRHLLLQPGHHPGLQQAPAIVALDIVHVLVHVVVVVIVVVVVVIAEKLVEVRDDW